MIGGWATGFLNDLRSASYVVRMHVRVDDQGKIGKFDLKPAELCTDRRNLTGTSGIHKNRTLANNQVAIR